MNNLIDSKIHIIPTSDKYIIYSPTRSSAFYASNDAKNIIDKAIKNEILSKAEMCSLAYKTYTQLLEKKERRISSNNARDIKYSTITLLLTDNCNLLCSYCYSSKSRNVNTINRKSLFKFLDELIITIPKNIKPRFVFMGGGEPLTKWELLKETVNKILFLSENHSRKIMFAITTNGTLLNEERIKFLKKHNFTINLSFDILPDIQNIQRSNIKGNSFEVVNKNICNLTDQSLNFSIRSTITSLNVGLQKEMVEFVHRNYPTVKRIHLEPATNSATDIIWINFIDNFIKARELGKSYDLDVVCSISNSINKLRKVFCPGEFTVTSEGDVVSCHRVSSNRDSNLRYFKYGQLTGKGYEVDRGLYNTQKDELYIHSQKFCNDCFARLHCAGYCPQAILTTIDNNLTMEKMCGYIRRLLTNVIEQDLTYKLKYSSN